MYMKDDYDLSMFDWWGGAIDTANRISDAEAWEEAEALIEEWFSYETPTITDVNDILWFDGDNLLAALGILTDEEREELGLD